MLKLLYKGNVSCTPIPTKACDDHTSASCGNRTESLKYVHTPSRVSSLLMPNVKCIGLALEIIISM